MRSPAIRTQLFSRRPALLVLGFAGFVLALVWGTVAALVISDRAQTFDDARREMAGGQRVLRAHVQRTFETAETQLMALDLWMSQASRMPLKNGLENLAEAFEQFHTTVEDPLRVRLIGNDLRLIPFGPFGNENIPVGDREYAREVVKLSPGQYHVGMPIVARDTGTEVIPIVLRAHPNAFGVAALVAGIQLNDFRKAFSDFLISAPATSGIFRRDGGVLIQAPEIETFTGSKIPNWDYDRFVARNGKAAFLEHNGPVTKRPRLTAITALDSLPLLVYTSISIQDLNDRWRARAVNHIVLGLFATGLTVALSFWLLALIRTKDRDAMRIAGALQEAERANRSKNDFMAKMSHELRTPLNAILGFSEMISDQRFEALATRHREYARDIHRSGRHLLALIDQILDIAKIESGVVQLAESEIDLDEFLEECLAVTAPLTRAKNLTVTVALEPGTRTLRADRKQLRQMLLNLLSNAAKFNRPNGRIAVKVARTGAGLALSVADTGLGIPDSALPHLFEPFGRGGTHVASETAEGIGLGLPITKALIELHDGRIDVAPVPGGGTVVTLHFPASRLPVPGLEIAA